MQCVRRGCEEGTCGRAPLGTAMHSAMLLPNSGGGEVSEPGTGLMLG